MAETLVELDDYSQYQNRPSGSCEIPAIVPEPEVCPTCIPDPTASDPRWRHIDPRTPVYVDLEAFDSKDSLGTVSDGYLNPRTCEYSIVVKSNHEGTGGSDAVLAERLYEALEPGIRGLLRFYDKIETEGGEGTVAALKLVANASEYHISDRPLLPMNILVTIPAIDFDAIGSAVDEDLRPESDKSSEDIVVSYTPGELHTFLTRITKTFRAYSFYQAMFEKKDGGYVIFKESGSFYDFDYQRRLLRDFLYALNDFLHRRGYTKILPEIVGGTNQFIFSTRKILGNIEIGLSPEYELKYINLTPKGCPTEKEEFEAKSVGLAAKEPCLNKTTMFYVVNLRDMSADVIARDAIAWEDFTIKYTVPEVTIKYGYGVGPDTESDDQLTTFGCFVNNLELDSAAGKLFDDLFSFSDFLAATWNDLLCMTDDQVGKLNLEYTDSVKMNEIIEKVTKEKYCPDQTIFSKEKYDESGISHTLTKNPSISHAALDPIKYLNYYWEHVFDKAGVCGMMALFQNAIKCLAAGLSYEQLIKLVVETAVGKLSISDFGRLFVFLPTETQYELQQEVKEILSLDNIIAPWEDPDVADSISGYGTLPGESGSGESLKASNSVGNQISILGATGQATEAIIEAYKEALLVKWDTLADLEILLEYLGRFPGADLLFSFVDDPDCPVPKVKNIPTLEWLSENKFSFCDGKELDLPEINLGELNQFRNVFDRFGVDNFRFMKETLKEKLIEMISQTMISAVHRAIQALVDALCDAVTAASEAVVDTVSAESTKEELALRNILRDAYCGEDATEEEIDDTIASLFASAGDVGSISQESLNDFISDLDSMLSTSEMAELFLNRASESAVGAILDLSEVKYPELQAVFPGPTTITKFFANLGSMTPEEVRDLLEEATFTPEDDTDVASNAAGCSTKPQLQDYEDVQVAKLQKDGTTPEQAKQQFDQETEGLEDDVKNLLSDMFDISGNIDDLLEGLEVFGDGGCSDDEALLPRDPEDLASEMGESVAATVSAVKENFDRDLTGRKGFLNMVLSDTLGNPYQKHLRKANRRRRYIDYFGQFYDLYNDTRHIDDAGKAEGWFPKTVAVHLQKSFDLISSADPSAITVASSVPSEIVSLPVFGSYDASMDIAGIGVTGYIEEKKNDITLSYRDGKDGIKPEKDQLEYNYGFDILYSHHDLDLLKQNLDVYRIKIVDVEALPESNKKDSPEDASYVEFCDIYVTGSLPETVYDLLSQYDRYTFDVPNQLNVFCATLAQSIFGLRYNTESTASDIFNKISLADYDELIEKHIVLFADEISGSQEAFTFGYDSSSAVTSNDFGYYDPFVNGKNIRVDGTHFYIDDPDNPVLQPYGAYYKGIIEAESPVAYSGLELQNMAKKEMERSKILGISSHERIYFLDPLLHGGKYYKPPIYVQPRTDKGWLGLSQALVPELDACDPKSSSLVDFNDIVDKVQEIYLSIEDDSRLDDDPDCAVENPYFKILERIAAANIEGSIAMTIRVYVVEVMLKALTVFSKYEAIINDVVDDLLVEYIIVLMELGLKEQGHRIKSPRNLLRGDDYWHAFLEQCVQVYRRKYLAGEVEPTTSISSAITTIEEKLKSFVAPTRKSFREAKRSGATTRKLFRYYKHDKIIEFVKETEREAKTIMRALVYEQFEYVSERFKDTLDDAELIPTVNSLDTHLVTELLEIKDVMPADSWQNPPKASSYDPNSFVFERYVIVEPKGDVTFETAAPGGGTTTTTVIPSPEFPIDPPSGVISLEEWQTWINDVTAADPAWAEENISNYFGDLIALQDEETEDVLEIQGTIGVRYGLRVSYVFPSGQKIDYSGTASESEMSEKHRAFWLNDVFMVPLANIELDAIDAPLSSYTDILGDYETNYVGCLLKDLISDPNYQLIFKYVVPLPRLLSLLAIYASRGFLPSIGQNLSTVENEGEDGTEGGGTNSLDGEWDEDASKTRGLTYYKWNQEAFKKTKKSVREMFDTFWNYRDPLSFDFNFEFDLSKLQRDLMGFNLGGQRLKWRLRRRFKDRPFDKDDEECD